MTEKHVLAVDFGASSGRVMLGSYDGEKISIRELHRFSNDPVILNGTMYWDFLRLFFEIKQGLLKAKSCGKIDSMGVDTWGVDFGLLDREGNLLENPVHYRDGRTQGMLKLGLSKMDQDRFYEITGNQFMEINTAFQLLSLVEHRPDILERADCLLLMPDLFNFFLSGIRASEYSIASTTQLMDAKNRVWSDEVLASLRIPGRLLQPIVPCGTKLGILRPDICEELGISPIDVIAVAGHDTQSALAAVPAEEDDFIFISCGTWSLFGTELPSPVINEKSAALNVTNEGGCGGKISFLKNIIGTWLIQESRRQWIREGKDYGFGQLEQLAGQAESFGSLVDPDAPVFVPAGNIPRRIRAYCQKTGQKCPELEGEIVRCIDESLALKYRGAFDEIIQCTGKKYSAIHMVGGGAQSGLLCQVTANACGCPVIAGPVEATVLGNVALQFMTAGAIRDLREARRVIMNSGDVKIYEPQDVEQWNEAYRGFEALIKSEKGQEAGRQEKKWN